MKKTALTILLTAFAAMAAHGQGAYDAWRFSENIYEGTARSVAMGNAFTALGGDLGAVSINPAGSAVAGYSQMVLTPAITVSSTTTTGVLPYGSSDLPYFDKTFKTDYTRAGIPNIGFSFNFDTGRKSGLKRVTAGFTVNRTNNWCEDLYAAGTNYTTSFAGAAAYDATENIAYYNLPENLPPDEPRYSYLDFIQEDSYEFYSPWKDIVGYQSGIFSVFDPEDDDSIPAGEQFIGSTEIGFRNGNIQQGGPLYQSYGRSVYGSKYEYLFNIGANISDFVYIGFNLGVNSLTYDMNEYFKEKAVDEYDFENIFTDSNGLEHKTYFRDLMYRYSYSASGTGVFGKLGIIVTPGNGLRFGAAIQTPTAMTINEQWQEKAETNFSSSDFNGSAASPVGEREYSFSSPFRANFGIAYTLGGFAVLSADYEMASYGSMRYKIDRYNMSDFEIGHFETINDDIRNAYGTAHQFRVGAEVKPLSVLAVRAGYNLMTSAQKSTYNSFTEEYESIAPTYGHNLSFGLGYISKKSFFADLACRYSFATTEYYKPYNDYQFDDAGKIVNYSPEIQIRTSNWKVLLTLGWRF